MFWKQARIAFHQAMNHLDTIPLGWYVAFFFAIVAIILFAEHQLKLVPNNRWRFGDKLK